jgi:hypothetical protein
MCRQKERLMNTFSKATSRYSDLVREVEHLTGTGDVNLFLDAFEAATKMRDECESARVALDAHLANHRC